jgi:plastocyanin
LTRIGSIRADVTGRLLTFSAALALFAVACAAPETTPVDFGEGARFVPSVADTLDDVGEGASIAIAEDGTAYVSYFGFPAEVAEGEIAIPRPIGSAFLPATLLTSIDGDGLITKGAVQQQKPSQGEPPGIKVPFRPDTVEKLDLTAANANGTSVAVGTDGSVHVVWTAGGAVYYAKVVKDADAAVSTVYETGTAVSQAGPLGRPAIALDGAGTPWIAFGANDAEGLREVVATPAGTSWDLADVAPLTACNGCPQPLPSGIVASGGAPLVVFGDPGASSVMAAVPDGTRWTVGTVETGVQGIGLSLAAMGEGAVAAYDTGAGAVHVATFDGSAWSSAEVAKVPDPAATSGLAAPTTGVAADADGNVYVAWQDDIGVHLASGDGAAFDEVGTKGTEKGASPTLAIDADGAVHLAWFDTASKDLMVGIYGDPGEVLLALPSPSPTVSLAPSADTSCGADGKIALDIVASGIAYDVNCLVAPAGEPFEINFSNQDAGVPHNVAIYTDSGAATALFQGEQFPGVADQTYSVDALDEGSYFFRCDVHPATMTGTLAVVKGAK